MWSYDLKMIIVQIIWMKCMSPDASNYVYIFWKKSQNYLDFISVFGPPITSKIHHGPSIQRFFFFFYLKLTFDLKMVNGKNVKHG